MDLRKKRSQERLQLALAKHLEDKTIDQITIGELTRSAGVSRQTFYSNFDSKQSILLSRIETLFERAWIKLDALIQSESIGRREFVEHCLRSLLEECERDRASMRAAFSGEAGIQALTLLKGFIARLVEERILFQFNHNFDALELDTISNFYAGGVIGAVQSYLMAQDPQDITTLTRVVGRLVPHGIDGLVLAS